MSVASRPVATGKTRTCPHCKATILESLSICPGCMHHLRFDSEAAKRQVAAAPALRVEGIIRHPPLEQPLEYFVIIAIRNDRGEEVTRQVVNVGALQAAEKRTFTLSVEVLPPQAPVSTKSNSSTGTFKSPIPQPQSPKSTAPTDAPASEASPTSSPTPASPANVGNPANPAGSVSPTNPATAASPAKSGTAASPTNPATAASPANPVTAASPPKPGIAVSPPKPGIAVSPPKPGIAVSPAKPPSGYVLKPPSPGGPKRH